jgi:molybdopterin converting factor small subunit
VANVAFTLPFGLTYPAPARRVAVSAGTIDEALRELSMREPALAPRISSESGELYVSVVHNGRQVRSTALAVVLEDGDEITLVPPLGGG